MSAEREKRARLSHACDRCRKRHVKCDGDYPICGNCKSFNGECCYSHPGSKRGYVETIDDRLSKIEQILTKFLEGSDTQQQKNNRNNNNDVDQISNNPEMGTYDVMHMSKHESLLSEGMSSLSLKNN
ncbi:4321_t:CDS:2, partial [Diversispora eburnea]